MSPISAKILSKTYIDEFSSAGILRPLQAIAHNKPTVFKVTVFPPVLGPVITKVEKSFPKLIEMGTTLLKSIKGWRAFIRLISFFRFILGVIPLISREYFALAKIKSKLPIKLISFFISSIYGKNREDNFINIFSISISSSIFNLLRLLFNSNIEIGSINTVEPALDIS